jgi:uncharacterized protein (TIGR02996 family)
VADRDAFLAAIAAAPADDLPRLVYADWLDDRGDADRAAFVRRQVAGRPAGDPAVEWLGPLAQWVYHADYARGMPEHLVLSAAAWLRHGERIRRLAPVRSVALLGAGRSLHDLVGGPHLRGLAGLHLTGAMLSDDGIDLLARCRHLSGLTTLKLGHNDVSDSGAADLADSPHLGRLETLVLRDNGVTLAGAMFLMHSKWLPRLKALDLSANAIHAEGVAAIRRSRLAKAIDVDVSDQQPPIPWSRRLLAAK